MSEGLFRSAQSGESPVYLCFNKHMFAIVIQLLLSSGDKTLEYWILTVVWWIPQLLWIAVATMLLSGVMLGLSRRWIRWVLMWVPYLMIGWTINTALDVEGHYYKFGNPFSIITRDTHLRDGWAPTFLAVPFLVILHVILFRKQAQRKARDA